MAYIEPSPRCLAFHTSPVPPLPICSCISKCSEKWKCFDEFWRSILLIRVVFNTLFTFKDDDRSSSFTRCWFAPREKEGNKEKLPRKLVSVGCAGHFSFQGHPTGDGGGESMHNFRIDFLGVAGELTNRSSEALKSITLVGLAFFTLDKSSVIAELLWTAWDPGVWTFFENAGVFDSYSKRTLGQVLLILQTSGHCDFLLLASLPPPLVWRQPLFLPRSFLDEADWREPPWPLGPPNLT